MRRDRIWISVSPNLGHSRIATLALLSEMVVQNATRVPGIRNSHPIGRGLADLNSNINDPFPSMGRARARNPGPHPSVKPLLCLLYSWPQCLCRCRCPLNAPPSPPSFESTSTSTSGPPSLESITEPESRDQVIRPQVHPHIQIKDSCFVFC